MAKFYGAIGCATSVETTPGVWKDAIVEHNYYGDVIRDSRRVQSADSLVDDVVISNSISIVADAFANENLYSMKYVEFMGVKWKITNIEVQPPRLILTLGGEYNGK